LSKKLELILQLLQKFF